MFVSRAEKFRAPRQKASWSLHKKTVVRPKTIERKNKNKQNPINAAPRVRRCSLIWDRYPMARRPLYYYYFLMLWKNGAFLPKISNPRFKNYYSTLTVLVWLQLSISFRLLLRTFRVVMHPNFRCLKVFIIFLYFFYYYYYFELLSFFLIVVVRFFKKETFSECVKTKVGLIIELLHKPCFISCTITIIILPTEWSFVCTYYTVQYLSMT